MLPRLSFSVVVIPQSLFCLGSLVVAQGIADDAFEPSFGSAEALLQRPLMEDHISAIRIPWKESALNKDIFPIAIEHVRALWRRTLLVAGFPETLRLYSLRVGAGSRLNGLQTRVSFNTKVTAFPNLCCHHRSPHARRP